MEINEKIEKLIVEVKKCETMLAGEEEVEIPAGIKEIFIEELEKQKQYPGHFYTDSENGMGVEAKFDYSKEKPELVVRLDLNVAFHERYSDPKKMLGMYSKLMSIRRSNVVRKNKSLLEEIKKCETMSDGDKSIEIPQGLKEAVTQLLENINTSKKPSTFVTIYRGDSSIAAFDYRDPFKSLPTIKIREDGLTQTFHWTLEDPKEILCYLNIVRRNQMNKEQGIADSKAR